MSLGSEFVMRIRESGRAALARALAACVLIAVAGLIDLPSGRPAVARADGEMDAGFGADGIMIDTALSGGRMVHVNGVVQVPSGSFVAAGILSDAAGHTQPFIVRYLPDGRRDSGFGANGVVFPAMQLMQLVALPDGRVAAETFIPASPSSPPLQAIGYVNPDGSMTTTRLKEVAIRQLVGRPDGSIVVVGYPYAWASNRLAVLLLPSDRVDPSYDGDVTAVLPTGGHVTNDGPVATLLTDGRLVVSFGYLLAGQTHCGVVALGPTGNIDPSFGSNGLVSLDSPCWVDRLSGDVIRVHRMTDLSMVLSADGQQLPMLGAPFDATPIALEGTGWFYTLAGSGIAAYTPWGELDPTFGVDGVATVPGVSFWRFQVLNSGDILVDGHGADGTSLALALIYAPYGTALQPPMLDTTKFVPLPPTRLLDTRDGTGVAVGKVGVGGAVELQVAGVAGVPATDVTAVVLNVTATDATQAGYVTAFPSGWRRPWASNLNVDAPGETVANLVTTAVGSNGKVTLFTSGGTHIVADIAGYYAPAFTSTEGRLETATPERILDTRDGLGAPKAKPGAGGQIDLQVSGRGSVPATGVEAVILNVTGDQADLDGYVTVWPAGMERPLASNINLTTAGTRANLAIVALGSAGAVSLFTSGGADLIVDVAGWFTDTSAPDDSIGLFVPIMPTRVLDTRQEPSSPTGAQSTVTRRIGATSVVPPDAAIAVAANITATQTTAAGYVTVWPANTPRPLVSNLNASGAGQTVPNAVVVALGQEDLALYSQSGAQLIVDIDGWFTNY